MSEQYYPENRKTSTMAIVSLIGGIAGWTIAPFIGSIVAVITGHMAKNEIKASAGTLDGDGLATVGLVLGYVSLGLALVGCLCVGLLLALGLIAIPWSTEFSSLVGLLAI